MKKSSFVVLLALSAVCLSACNSPSSVKGEFLNNEYILSLEDVKDFYDELQVKGVDKDKIILSSSNTKILKSTNGEDFKALSSGKAYIFAKYKNKTVAKVKVNVKYQLSSPQNFNLSTDGVLTWDKSSAVVDGKSYSAPEYKIETAQIVELDDLNYESQTITTNSIEFSKKASYSVKITALSDNELVDNSKEITKVFHYGVMGVLEETEFSADQEFGSQKATLTWAEKVDAKYDVYVEGFKLKSDITDESFTFDYSIYQANESVEVEIIAKDANNEKFSTSTKFNVNILETPDLNYSFNKEGKLVWNNDVNCSSYKLKISDYQGDFTYKEVTDRAHLEEVLEGYTQGIYDIQITAVGGENNGFYISSKPSETIRTAKLGTPQVEIEFVDNKANITFPQDDYVTDYKISYNFYSVYYSTKNGHTVSLNMTGVPVGQHNIEIIALPKADTSSESGVAELAFGSNKSNIVLNSDKIDVEFFVLGEIGEVVHILQGNTSTFTFPSVENANFYRLFINDVQMEAVNIFEENGIVTCEMSNLSSITPKNGGYDIKVIAGRIDNSTRKEIATRSTRLKRLEILDTATQATNQTNGSFAWQDIADDCLYSYEVYKTASDYAVTSGQSPILQETNVDVLKISQVLSEGYYKVRVKSISIDRNLYLDSDFNDKNNVLEVNFYVTKDIQTPSATFFVDGDKYKLNISTVENASLYEVYVNGVLDGQLSSEGLAVEEYVFSDDFAQEKVHNVTVKALAGSRYDGTIYLTSDAYALNVTRLATPQYMVNVEYSDFDQANHEYLTIKQIANSTKVDFYLNGVQTTAQDYRIDVVDYNTFGTEFKIGLILKADDSQGNNYYLDSHLKEIEFVRADYPSAIKYTDGKLTWTQNQEDAEKNYLSLIVSSGTTSSDYFKRFEIDVNPQEFNLQSYINNLRKSDLAFDTAYRQVEKLQIKMLTYMNEESDKYYLPSFYGATTNGTNTLDVKLLDTPELSFDTETEIISWGNSVEGTRFDIYVDDVIAVEDYTLANSISLAELGNYDFTTQKKITIRAKNSSYLNSDLSSAIYIKKLTTPTSLSITKDGNDTRATILINSDSANVSNVHVNGASDNVSYTVGSNMASFVLSDFATNSFAINLVAKNEGNLNYYISSEPITYTLVDLKTQAFEVSLNAESISWNEMGTDATGHDIFPIKYVMTIKNNGKTVEKIFEDKTLIKLTDLESYAGELVGEVVVSVKAVVNEDYILSSNGTTPKGYYGETISSSVTTHKLAQVESANVIVEDGSGYTTQIDRKINSSIKVVFADLWADFEGVIFTINLANSIFPIKVEVPQTGVTHLNYSFAKVGDNFEFKLPATLIKQLPAGEYTITIDVKCEKEIPSQSYSLSLNKFDKTASISVNEDGILTIDDNQENASYLIEIATEDSIIEKSLLVEEGKTLNLMDEDILLNRKGAYTIRVLTFDSTSTIVPAGEATTVQGYKLQGIESVEINEEGNIIFTVYTDDLTNAVFTAECQETRRTFTPTPVEESQNQFYISMLDLLNVFANDISMIEGQYDFKFFIKDQGSMNSSPVELSFCYAIDQTPILTRGLNLDRDYIIFAISEKSDTVSFRSIIKATFYVENVDEESRAITYTPEYRTINVSYPSSLTHGYWVTDSNGENGYFTTEKDTTSSHIFTDGYWKEDSNGNNGQFVTEVADDGYNYTAGFWVTDDEGNNGYFSTNKLDRVYTECYAINVNDILADLDYGFADISVSRIGKKDKLYYQYNQTDFRVYKLNKINDVAGEEGSITVKDNFLTFSWTQKDNYIDALNKKPTAYYVFFSDLSGKVVTRTTTYVCSLDLRDTSLGLTAGTGYNISVVAVSVDTNTIASDLSGSANMVRYTAPLALQVKGGMLTFNETSFGESAFMQDIKNYFIQTDEQSQENQSYHSQVGNKQYLSPYYYSVSQLKDMYLTLQFAKINSTGGVTNEVYKVTVPGYWLFPDIEIPFNLSQYIEIGQENVKSYYSLLSEYVDNEEFKSLTTTEALNVQSMVDALKTSPRGIGDNAILFDDLGRGVPAGAYSVSVIQTKSNQYVESVNGPAIPMYISASPDITLKTQVINNLTQYMFDITPAGTMVKTENGYVEGAATTYKLSLRPTDGEGTYQLSGNIELIIKYENEEWAIYYQGMEIEGAISSNNRNNYGIPGFTVNMSVLRKPVNALYKTLNGTTEDIIPANALLRADVFVYDQDDLYVLNGKSAVFNVRYLDLKANYIYFEGGKFVVRGEDNDLDNYELLVKYKRSTQGEQSFTTKVVNNEAILQFNEAGEYTYIVLSLNGSISSNTMNIESSSYGIYNLYKLHTPELSTSNSNLIINYTSDDTNYMSTLQFNMANDISLNESYSSPESSAVDKGYYYQSTITSTTTLSPYVVGSRNTNGDTLYPSELMASEFYAYLNGNTGSFTLSEGGHEFADYLLTFSDTYAVMTSDECSIKARMLAYIDSYELSEGHLVLDDRHVGIDLITNKEGEHLSGNLVFEIVIEYYVEDNTNPGYGIKVGEETFYSERQYASDVYSMVQVFNGLNFNTSYDLFRVGVTVLGALKVDEDTPNAIETVEGTYVLLKNTAYFSEDGAQVLRSQEQKAPFMLHRTAIPYLSSGSKGIKTGNVEFVIDNTGESIYYGDEFGADIDTAKRLLVYAEYVQGGVTYWQLLTGSYTFEKLTTSGMENQVAVSFTPDEGQLNDIVGSFKIRIYAYGNGTVISNPLLISDVYKLPKVESKYYDILLDGSNTILSFQKYFDSISINNDAKCYKLVVSYKLSDSDELLTQSFKYGDAILQFTLPQNVVYIDMQVQDGQDASEVNPKKLIYSDTTLFDIQKTDVTGLSVSWNATDMRFEWAWDSENNDEYEYHVTIIVGGKKTTEVVTTNYYMPKDRGTIATNGFEIRARKLGTSNSELLYTYSDAVPYTGSEIAYNIFSGGNGTKANPYLIRTKADFINISKRNTSAFYFKLDANNITIDIADLYQIGMTEFNSHLDGNGYTLKVCSTQVFDLAESYTSNLISAKNIEFTQYSSLFNKLNTSASISNLFLDYEINYTALNNSSILFSPLCAYNYGTIDNVKVTKLAITSLNGRGSTNACFVGGIASVNYGVIKNSINSATFDYTMAQQLSLTFGHAGIATFNASSTYYTGSIENSYNQASKSVSVTVNNNLVYMAGITLANSGKISKAGNDGQLTLSAKSSITSMTGYFAGITVSSINGTLEYVYNNAVITNTSSYGAFNYSGIAYEISGGIIKYLVVTVSGQALVKNCTIKPSDGGSNYAPSNSGTNTYIATKELSAQAIECGNGYTLNIAETENGYTASITKA